MCVCIGFRFFLPREGSILLCLPKDYPRRVTVEVVCRSRLKRRHLRYEAENRYKVLGEYLNYFAFKPLVKVLGKVSVFSGFSVVFAKENNVDTIKITVEI